MFLDPRHPLFTVLFAGAIGLLPACGGGGTGDDAPTDTDSGGSDTGDGGSDPGDPTGTGDPTDTDGSGDGGDAAQAPSARAHLKFKTAYRYAADLATALELPLSDVCQELSTYDCAQVHRISLGEVDPYALRLYEPLLQAPLSAPIAVDRIALSACGMRAEQDFSDPDGATLFAEVASDPTLAGEGARADVVARLYRRLLLREVEPHELQAVLALYDDLQNEDAPAKTWAQLSCFAIATSVEALFY